MPSRIVNEICERVRNMPRMAFILDTSFVFGSGSEHTAAYLDFDYASDVNEAAEHVRNVESLLNQNKTIIVPIEVRQEINEGIDTIDRVRKAIKKHNKKNQPEYSAVSGYINNLRRFQERSEGCDPRFLKSVGNVSFIDIESRAYQNTWSHYQQEVFNRHMRKGKEPTIADIAISTLAYMIQNQRVMPCILTRDTDFESVARSTRAQTEKRELVLKEGRLAYLSGRDFKTSVYLPFSNVV